jgi:pyruvate dehydrogenase E2 component (dihydrolipoamide acetyltransferase)
MTGDILRMPRLGETMEEGVLVGWLVAPGQPFCRGDPLVEIETDKTVAEFTALSDGVLIETLAKAGDRLSVGTPIARIETAAAATLPSAPQAPPPAPPPAPVSTPSPAGEPPARPRATPLARRLARAQGVNLAAITGTGRRGRIERRDLETASAPGLRLLDGVAWHESGSPGGPLVLLLHGFAADHAVWAGLAATLARAGARTLAPDLPGHGRTTLPATTPGGLAAPLHAALPAFSGAAPLHIVAHSLGAVPAVTLAASGAAATLTLIAPAGLGLAIDATFVRDLARAQSPGEVAHLLDRLTDGPNGLSEAAITRLAAMLAEGRLTALADSLLGESGQAVSLRADLVRLAAQMPVHLVLGHRDRILDWRDGLDISPRIAVHHLPRAGHMPQWEALPDLAAILSRIIGLPPIPALAGQMET